MKLQGKAFDLDSACILYMYNILYTFPITQDVVFSVCIVRTVCLIVFRDTILF